MILLRVITVGFTLRNVMREKVEDADAGAGRHRLNPQAKIPGEDGEEHERND